MVTLREILDLTWTVTCLTVDVRTPEGRLIKCHRFGEGENEVNASMYDYHRIKSGELELHDVKINHHGDEVRGTSEMGWGTNFSVIPDELLDGEVTHFKMREAMKEGSQLTAQVCTDRQMSLFRGGM